VAEVLNRLGSKDRFLRVGLDVDGSKTVQHSCDMEAVSLDVGSSSHHNQIIHVGKSDGVKAGVIEGTVHPALKSLGS
jgi:hypothetical protein